MTIKKRNRHSLTAKLATVHPIVAIILVLLFIFIAWQATASKDSGAPKELTPADSLMIVITHNDMPEQLVRYTGFTVSFNKLMHQPNYVAWELTADEAQAEGRRESNFQPDPDVEGCATLNDYRNSGFDRGHMIPAADVKWSAEAMAASHYLTNICPQDHKLNAGAWANLEGNCRNWAKRDSAIIIISGPVLTDKLTREIGRDNIIPVPERYFKVVLSPYTNPPAGIGFIMNNGTVTAGVQGAAVTIDQVEAITGYDFFSALPDDVENEVESQCAYHKWQRKK